MQCFGVGAVDGVLVVLLGILLLPVAFFFAGGLLCLFFFSGALLK